MAVAARGEIRQDFQLLKRAVEDAIQQNPTSLAQVRSVLAQALHAVKAIRSDQDTGAYVVPIAPERMASTFRRGGGRDARSRPRNRLGPTPGGRRRSSVDGSIGKRPLLCLAPS